MNTLIVGDLHLGKRHRLYPGRDFDVCEAVETFAKEIERPGWVIIAGDLFDSPRPSPETYFTAFSLVSKLVKSGLHVAIIAGNHDLGHTTSALDPFSSSIMPDQITVGSHEPTGALPFWLFDWGEANDAIVNRIDQLVVAHGTHEKSPLAPPSEALGAAERVHGVWGEPGGVMVLGHLHHGHEFTDRGHRYVYTGPPVQTAFGEGRPGYVLADIAPGGEIKAVEWRESKVGKRFINYEDWRGEKDAIVKAVVKAEAEAERLRLVFERDEVAGEVLVKPDAQVSEIGKAVATGFELGGPVEAYTAYVKHNGREPHAAVLKVLNNLR